MAIGTVIDIPNASSVSPPGRPEPRWLRLLGAHPFLTVAAVGLLVRVALALLAFLWHGYVAGDEQQYVDVAKTVASGKPAESWFPQFGQSFYDATWTYTGVVRFLFSVFTPSRLVAQLYAAAGGVAVAVLTVVLARRFVSTAFAAVAGLIVALLPSQVLWSSIALRESLVWLALIGLAVLLARAIEIDDLRTLLVVGVGVCILVVALGHLRNQTLVVAVWAMILASWFGHRRRLLRGGSILAIGMFLPVLLGLGVTGLGFVTEGVSSLSTERAYLSFGANSAVPKLDEVTPTTQPSAGDPTTSVPWTTTTLTVPGDPNARVISSPDGTQYQVEETTSAHLDYLPSGLIAFLVRPYLWEPTETSSSKLARVENLAWFALYALALAGAWLARRNPAAAYPVILAAGIIGINGLSQGNVGTAFRHRGQLLWVFAVFAAVALERLYLWRFGRLDGQAIG